MDVDAVEVCSGRTDGLADSEPHIYPQESMDEGGDDSPRPLVRSRNEHGVSRRDIDPDALKVLYRLSRNKYTAYLVGGGVRDLLLGRKPKDFDISTDARPEQIRALFRNCILIGRRFRLAHIRYGEKIIETSTFRRTPETVADPNDPDADLFQRDDNLFGTPQEDALRRDFTVNGLFYDIDTFSIIDYVGGMEDLAARRIRSIGDPCIRFREDPIRMVRAIRFASRLDFDLDPDTLDAIHKHGDEITKAAPARLLEEIIRLFAFASGEKAVGLLNSTGLLKIILPEVAACLENPKADLARFRQRLRALDTGDTVLPDATPALIFATLLTDALQFSLVRDHRGGTPPRLRYDKARSFIEPMASRLKFPKKLTERIVHIFMSQHRFSGQGAKRGSLAGFVTQDWFHESLALAEINLTAVGGDQSTLNPWRDMLAERIYGKEEPREERHAGHLVNGNNNGNGHANGNNGNGGDHDDAETASDALPGKKLSRSARRRRNKQRNKQRRLAEAQTQTPVDAGETAQTPEAIVEARPARPGEESGQATAVPEKPAAGEEKAEKKREKSGKAKSRRERKKSAAKQPVQKPEETAVNTEAADAPPPAPLTAAAFYNPESEKPKKKEEPKKKAPAKRAAKKKAEKPERDQPAEPAKPLAMDKADEASQPMHWLDEVDFL